MFCLASPGPGLQCQACWLPSLKGCSSHIAPGWRSCLEVHPSAAAVPAVQAQTLPVRMVMCAAATAAASLPAASGAPASPLAAALCSSRRSCSFRASFSALRPSSRALCTVRCASVSGLFTKCTTRVFALSYSPRPKRSCTKVAGQQCLRVQGRGATAPDAWRTCFAGGLLHHQSAAFLSTVGHGSALSPADAVPREVHCPGLGINICECSPHLLLMEVGLRHASPPASAAAG